ncbi:glycosyltransferase [Paenibacillus sp. alder61]|uniref:Glycosyltransferase family 2 protein n=1 Tax=Paenibacillus faecis TaxID=862114 RepID=A0A5D0CQ38_9BACL|nr:MULTISPECIES: glycosyltransferase [Paenibacillus]MCA1293974.1 glycosyltransferase [Paenibacillus sp. alder61]TYA11858.1 glycosyltransferase family 2 protein [Paenibacillus faecis]
MTEKELSIQIDQDLQKIDSLLDSQLIDEAYTEYVNLLEKIEGKEYKDINRQYKAKVYISFAYFLFSGSQFNSFFEMLLKAQEYGHPKDEIEEVILEAFVRPNLNEFRNLYEANINFLHKNNYIDIEKIIHFDDLPFWLLPNGIPNEYYLYNKSQKLLQDKVTLFTYKQVQSLPTLDAFSDYLLLGDWNWNTVLAYNNSARKRSKKTYVVLKDIEKSLSCLQGALLNSAIISNVVIFDSLDRFRQYMSSSDLFLPRNIINLSDSSSMPQYILDEIHDNRIHKDNRKGNRVLLSVCIPSYNRGKRAYENVVHLLQSQYDEEIEIILSNNGTQNETKAYYDKISEIEDARLKYFAFNENQGFASNCCKVCELASGKFILLLSDEDLINLNNLHFIMNKLCISNDTISVMRTSSTTQYNLSNLVANPGRDALINFMLSSNYMSGIILNNKLLKNYRGIEYIKENLNNSVCYWYPHMYWELLLCQYGFVESTDLVLVNEGKAEKSEFDKLKIDDEVVIPYYASIKGRLEQHEGFTHIFRDLEICAKDPGLYREMYLQLCAKTLFLTTVSINGYYKRTSTDYKQLYEQVYEFCSSESFYKTKISNTNDNYRSDLEILAQIYGHFKKSI